MRLAQRSRSASILEAAHIALPALQLVCGALVFLLVLGACRSAPQVEGVDCPPRGFANTALLRAALAIGLVDLVETEPSIPGTVEAFCGLEFRRIGGRALALDLYRPAGLVEPAPLLVFIHGGSWKGGNRDDYRRYLVDYAQKGYVTATVSYRLMQEAVHPAALDDVRCAVAWLGDHADEYLIDSRRVALIGGSAGGHLALMAAYATPSGTGEHGEDVCRIAPPVLIRCVVSFYGPSDLTTDFARSHPTVEGLLGASYATSPERFAHASPISHVSSDDPPTLIFHGTIDETVPVAQSDALAERLSDSGVAVEYHRLRGWPHTMDAVVPVNEYCQQVMDGFFSRHLAVDDLEPNSGR